MQKTKDLHLIIFIIGALLLSACSESEKKYRIGVSQCSEDIWREKQNSELRMAAYFHEDVDLHFAAAYDSDERQVQQIDSLVNLGIDLLIVAPNQVSTISPAIDRAYDKGIPVIVFERKTSSKKYTAFMGADNHEMGSLMGDYIVGRLKGHGKVMEVMGLNGSSPAIERHNGFRETVGRNPGLEIVATLQGDWTEPTAYGIVKQWLQTHKDTPVDLVFGMNDRSAMGARKAFMEAIEDGNTPQLPLFCGIDGLPGKHGGIQLVRDSLLAASYIYPTHGDQLLQLAIDILDGKPYEKETRLMSALVTHDNARVLQMESEEVMRQSQYLEQLNQRVSGYLQQLANQRTLTLLAVAMLLLLLLLMVGVYMYQRQRTRIGKERRRLEREQLDFYAQVSHELRTPLTLIEGPLARLAEMDDMRQIGDESANLFAIVRRNTHQLTQLINKLLEGPGDNRTGRKEEGKKKLSEKKATDSTAKAETSQPKLSTPNAQQKELILIVDDNADIRAYLRSFLQDRYRLLEAEDGKKGCELAQNEVPDLIVSDVMMPVMNGLQFCQKVKEDVVTSHIPVILLTARALSAHQIEGYKSGADAYITKPFAPDVLLARIENLIHSRKVLKQLFTSNMSTTEQAQATTISVQTAPAAIPPQESAFLVRFRKVVETQLSNSDLSVEDIGSEMGLSRVQLYRKIKALTGQTPVEQLRTARLIKGRQLLETTDKTVAEVAYSVGFTAPSYFAKCFKDEFGMSPSEFGKRE